MARHLVDIGTLTIAAAGTASNIIVSKVGFGGATDLTIIGPTALTSVVSVQVSEKENAAAGDMRTLQFQGTDVLVVAGKATIVPGVAFKALRILAAGAEAAQRDCAVIAQIEGA